MALSTRRAHLLLSIFTLAFEPSSSNIFSSFIDSATSGLTKPRRRIQQIDLDYFDPASCPEPEKYVQNPHIPRRLQFGTTAEGTPSPTGTTTPGPTPDASLLFRTDTEPYILVDFNNHISWDDANAYCQEQLNSTLASVWNNRIDRITEEDQIKLMNTLCKGDPDNPVNHPGANGASCWIGLRYYDDGAEFFQWISNNQYLDPDDGDWIPGTTAPTAFTFQSGNQIGMVCDLHSLYLLQEPFITQLVALCSFVSLL